MLNKHAIFLKYVELADRQITKLKFT